MSDFAAAARSIRQVPFFAKAPSAADVRVTGDFTDWGRRGIRLTGSRSGDWCALLPLEPGVYEYRLLIDGEWADHAEANLRVENPFGSRNCVLVVS